MSINLLNHSLKTQSQPVFERRPLERLVATFDDVASRSQHIINRPVTRPGELPHPLPRYLYLGGRGGGDMLRLGIFATVHGDEPEGALALTRFLNRLEQSPELGEGYALFLYPVCNPTGFEDGTRHSRTGKDLNREFWRQSSEPEVRFLEAEIWAHAFHGIITLHSDDTSRGLYGYVNGQVLSEHLLEPALRAAERYWPRNRHPVIDGRPARNGIIYQTIDGVLQSVPGLEQPPFELRLETPQKAPLHLQIESLAAALTSILTEYRRLMAVAQNI